MRNLLIIGHSMMGRRFPGLRNPEFEAETPLGSRRESPFGWGI
jgi:hypothetical protein